MNRTQEIAAESLAILTACLERKLFDDAHAWREDHGDYEAAHEVQGLQARARAVVEGRMACYLCSIGTPRHRGGHGFGLPGLGMVDCVCPITQEAYDKLVADIREAADAMKAEFAKRGPR